LSYAVLACCFE